MNRMRWIMLCAVVVGLASALIVRAAEAEKPEAEKPTPPSPAKIEFTEETLDNGMRVIYAPMHQAPVVHVRVLYHVGSRDERPDRQGFAHMFEHMMFRGSAHVPPEQHMRLVSTVGGHCNAFTSFDQTVYVNTLPSQYLEMALWLEADRMSSFKVSEQIYKTERNVVAEEWRMRNNRPYGNLYEEFLKKAFVKHSYRWTPIGNMDHLRAAPVDELQDFFNTYYVPNNATLVIAGDFELDQARRMVKQYMGWIPKGSEIARDIPAEPEQTDARTSEINQAVPLPAIVIGYKLPEYKADDHFALSLLSTILGGGDSSRLKRLLVNGKSPQAVDAYAMHMRLQDAGIFGVGAVVMHGKDPTKVQEALNRAVSEVIIEGVTPEELEKAKTQERIGLIHGQETAEDLASQLGDETMFADDPNRVNTAMDKLNAVTAHDVQRIAAKYLTPEKATTLKVTPSLLAAAGAMAANKAAEDVKSAPVAPATKPVQARVITFPDGYPTTNPTASARQTPEFAKGVESEINGVKVIVMSDKRLPIVNWSLIMRRGSQSDPEGKEGTAWLTAELMRRGVKGMNFEDLTRDLDTRGISINVGDGGDNTRLHGSCTSEQLDHAITRSRQILQEPTFPQDEFAKLKEQSINALRMGQDDPSTVAGNELTEAIYGDSVLGRYSTPQTVAKITLDDVKSFYQTVYRPTDAIFIISGDVSVERGREMAGKLLEGWSSAGELATVKYDLPAAPTTRRIILVDRPEGKQATVRMAVRAYDIHQPEKFSGAVANQILSRGIEGRLMKYVRAEKGLCYDCRGTFQPNRQAGTFGGSVDTALESTSAAVEAMFKVFSDMRTADVTDKELDESKQKVAGSMVMAMQTIDQQAGMRGDGVLNGYPIDYYDKYPQRIAEISKDQVRDVMKQYVDDGRMVIVVVAPAEKVKTQLEKLGTVEVLPMPAKRAGATTQPSKELLKKAA